MNGTYEILYKNFLGNRKILITRTLPDTPHAKWSNTYVSREDILHATLWVNDNLIIKNRYGRNRPVDIQQVIDLFKID